MTTEMKAEMGVRPPSSTLSGENNLRTFLAKRRVERGEDFTHTSLGDPCPGSFYIDHYDLPQLHDLLADANHAKHPTSLTERHKPISPFLIDLDFRQRSSSREYSTQAVHGFMNILLTKIRDYVQQDRMTCYILEKAIPRYDDKQKCYKDGIHIVFPDVITHPAIQHHVRHLILQHHADWFTQDTHWMNTPDQIYDNKVIDQNNWFLYGSKKPAEPYAWTVTQGFKLVMTRGQEGMEEIALTDISHRQWLDILSIRMHVHQESRYTAQGRDIIRQSAMLAKKPSPLNTLIVRENQYPTDNDSSITSHSTLHTHVTTSIPDSKYEELKHLVSLLSPQRAERYDDWMRVGWALHNAEASGRMLQVWIEFSKQSSKYQTGECGRLWDTMRPDGELTWRSIAYWAKQDDPEAYNEYLQENMTQKEEGSEWSVFLSNELHTYAETRVVFEQKVFKVMHPICYIEEGLNNHLILRDESKIKKAYRNVYCMVTNKKTDKSTSTKKVRFIDYWLDDPKIRTYQAVDFLPPPLTCHPGTYNLWKGFHASRLSVHEKVDLTQFHEHIALLCNKDPAMQDYFVKWLAHMFQRPGEINGISFVFISKQGSGKNVFFNKLAQIMGKNLYYETPDPERDLFSRFSNGRKDKLLIDIDEANKKFSFDYCEQLKNMITSEYFNYEQKGMDPLTLRNFARVVFTTNNSIPIKITSDTRRYVIAECCSEKIGDTDYFNTFIKYMDDPATQKAVYEYLMTVDISKVDWIRDRPLSEAYRDIQGCCADLPHLFLEELCIKQKQNGTLFEIFGGELFQEFIKYLRNRHTREEMIQRWNHKTFGMELKKICNDRSGILKKEYRHKSKYVVDLNVLENYLKQKGLCRDISYMFLD